MDPDQQLRNLKDFLLVYNRMTEICFQRCGSNFNYRNLTMDEERCLDNCAGKLIRSNHRLMNTYVQLMPKMVQRRMDELESKAAENAKAEAEAAAATAAATGGAALASAPASAPTELTQATETFTQEPPLLPLPVMDMGVEASVAKPAGLDIPLELGASASQPKVATGVDLSAATPFTPASDILNSVALDRAGGDGPSHAARFPQPQLEALGSVPAFTPPKPADAPVSIGIAPPAESLSGREGTPQLPPTSDQ